MTEWENAVDGLWGYVRKLERELTESTHYAECLEQYGYNKTYMWSGYLCWNKDRKQHKIMLPMGFVGLHYDNVYEDEFTAQYKFGEDVLFVLDKRDETYIITKVAKNEL